MSRLYLSLPPMHCQFLQHIEHDLNKSETKRSTSLKRGSHWFNSYVRIVQEEHHSSNKSSSNEEHHSSSSSAPGAGGVGQGRFLPNKLSAKLPQSIFLGPPRPVANIDCRHSCSLQTAFCLFCLSRQKLANPPTTAHHHHFCRNDWWIWRNGLWSRN